MSFPLLLNQQKVNNKKNINVKEILLKSTKILRDKKIDEPYLNSEILLAYCLRKERIDLYSKDLIITSQLLKKYFALIKKRTKGIPLQYLIGKVNFYGYDFQIKKGVFIPRPETEILVEETIKIYKKYFSPNIIKILDIGTGCGNIAISLGKEIENCHITATDISEDALKLAKENAYLLNVKNKIKFIKTNFFSCLNDKFHIIISNPPYIPENELKNLPLEVKKEPELALNGGKFGLVYIQKILKQGWKYLFENGFLILEIGKGQGDFLKKEKFFSLKLIKFVNDLNNIERIVVLKKIK